MNCKTGILALLALASLGIIGCDNFAMYGRPETIDPRRLFIGDSDLQSNTRIAPIVASQDSSGILRLQLPIRSTQDNDQYVDAFVTFFRRGQVVEKLGPFTQVLRGNVPDTFTFNSTQPADDYQITLRDAK